MDINNSRLVQNRFFISLAVLCAVSVGLLLFRVIASDSTRYIFLIWNLVLATIPLLTVIWLTQRIRKYGWYRWQQISLTAVFLLFLPNSFYLVTDLVHLRETYEVSLIFDVVLLASFMWSGLVLGYSAIFILHREIKRRVSERDSFFIIGAIFLAVSFAIYLGRYTRWNTWDLILQPAGLLFDVSERFINPAVHADTYQTTAVLFVLLSSLYAVIYEAARLLRHP